MASQTECPRCTPQFDISAPKPVIAPPPKPALPNFTPPPKAPTAPLKMTKPQEPISPRQLIVGIVLAVGMFLLLLQFRTWRRDMRAERNARMYEPFMGGPPAAQTQPFGNDMNTGQPTVVVPLKSNQNTAAAENMQRMQQQMQEMQNKNMEQMQQRAAANQERRVGQYEPSQARRASSEGV